MRVSYVAGNMCWAVALGTIRCWRPRGRGLPDIARHVIDPSRAFKPPFLDFNGML
jgi:hypothetical protein